MLESREDPRDQRTHVDVGHAGEHAPSPSWAEFRLAAHCRDTRTPHAVLRPRRPRALRAPTRAWAVTPGRGLRRLLGPREHRSDGAVTPAPGVGRLRRCRRRQRPHRRRPCAVAGAPASIGRNGPRALRARPAANRGRGAVARPTPTVAPAVFPSPGRGGDRMGPPPRGVSDRPTLSPAGAAGRGRRRGIPWGRRRHWNDGERWSREPRPVPCRA